MEYSQTRNSDPVSQEQLFQIGLEKIRDNFRLALDEKLSEIEQCMHQIENDNQAAPALTQLSQSAHKFRGAATTLGYGELGDAAATLEDCITDINNSAQEPSEMALLFIDSYRRFVGEISKLI